VDLSHWWLSLNPNPNIETLNGSFIINNVHLYVTDDVQEAYTLIKDLEPTTPQVVIVSHYQVS
jgi:hypothetical protein